jgi:hypothetical protein
MLDIVRHFFVISDNKKCQYNNQLLEDGSKANSRNVVRIKYTTDSRQCAAQCSYNESAVVTNVYRIIVGRSPME